MTEPRKKIWRAPWSAAAGQRLRLAIAAAGLTQTDLRDENGEPIKRPTLSGWLSGAQAPPMVRLEAVCRQLRINIQSVLSEPEEQSTLQDRRRHWGSEMLDRIAQLQLRSTSIEVPIYDIEVAAGGGRSVHDETPIGHWPLPVSWVAQHVVGEPDLFVVTVNGDSQEPELSTGDQLIVDQNQQQLRPGMHVVRHDGYLQVKRIQLEGRKVMLLSANPAYATTILDRQADQDSFKVVGRVVGAIKAL